MRFFLLILFFLTCTLAHAQTALDWYDLSEGITLELPSTEAIFPEFQRATFSSKLKALKGEKVNITGYLLIAGGKQSTYLLSKNPMASCFFCGNGGPETVLDLRFLQKPSFEMDELLSVEGTFYFNEDDPRACYYRIEKAEAISFE